MIQYYIEGYIFIGCVFAIMIFMNHKEVIKTEALHHWRNLGEDGPPSFAFVSLLIILFIIMLVLPWPIQVFRYGPWTK